MTSDDRNSLLAGCVIALLTFPVFSLLFGGCYALSGVQTSDGLRDSTVRKISESGVIWKTTEVETLGDGRLTPETFRYSVRREDGELLKKLKALPAGKRVRIHYRHMLTAWQPKGETAYFITNVEELP